MGSGRRCSGGGREGRVKKVRLYNKVFDFSLHSMARSLLSGMEPVCVAGH